MCGSQTWHVLVEAGWRLGDRFLYLAEPMLRGDDVAELQQRLGGLGFDAGRVDAIFGGKTEKALRDFQRNAGLVVDGNCGPATIQALSRLGGRCGAPPVAGVREWERLRSGAAAGLVGRRVAVAGETSAGALVTTVVRSLSRAGAIAIALQHPDESAQASEANATEADVFLGLTLTPASACAISYYARHDGWESPTGRHLAELLAQRLGTDRASATVAGMATPALRETRMPAVICELGPAGEVVTRSSAVADAVLEALASWVAEDPEQTH